LISILSSAQSETGKLQKPVLATWNKSGPGLKLQISNTSRKVIGAISSEGFSRCH